MPDIDKALVHRLKNYAGLNALVSGRVYPDKLPQSVDLPAVVYQMISLLAIHVHGERSALPRPRYQITIWGRRKADTVAVARQVDLALNGYKGTWGTGDYVTEVESSLIDDQRDFLDGVTGLFYRQLDYYIMFKE